MFFKIRACYIKAKLKLIVFNPFIIFFFWIITIATVHRKEFSIIIIIIIIIINSKGPNRREAVGNKQGVWNLPKYLIYGGSGWINRGGHVELFQIFDKRGGKTDRVEFEQPR